jgi:integrase
MAASQTPLCQPESEDRLDALQKLLRDLPGLPSTIRYYDDFDDRLRSIDGLEHAVNCELWVNGSKRTINFDVVDEPRGKLMKHLLFYFFSENLTPSTAYNYLYALYHIGRQELGDLISSGPHNIKSLWITLQIEKNWPIYACYAAKALLRFLASYRINGWSPTYQDFLEKTLPLPYVDHYAALRSGNAFLSIHEEANIVGYLDSFAASMTANPAAIGFDELNCAGLLLCSYQFGMRAVQIAALNLRSVRIWNESADQPSVHLTFKTAKQRSKKTSRLLLRKIKFEWASIIAGLYQRKIDAGCLGNDRLFSADSASEAAKAIKLLASEITGKHTTTTILRHTAAQRLVDAGASLEELAEFMGHSNTLTSLVYFQHSPNQAEQINRALGISKTYQQVAKIAHDRFIGHEELSRLKGEQQIAGVPHGIPIAGIGGCSQGQPSCPYNPVTSCYGCPKFMPLLELDIHKKVLADLRVVVLFFNQASRSEPHSPAYLQLMKTIANVQAVITEIEGCQRV